MESLFCSHQATSLHRHTDIICWSRARNLQSPEQHLSLHPGLAGCDEERALEAVREALRLLGPEVVVTEAAAGWEDGMSCAGASDLASDSGIGSTIDDCFLGGAEVRWRVGASRDGDEIGLALVVERKGKIKTRTDGQGITFCLGVRKT